MRLGIGKTAILALVLLSGTARAAFNMEVDPISPPGKGGAPQKVEVLSVTPATEPKAAPAPAAVEEKKQPIWVVKPNSRLRAVVSEFAARAGWVVEVNYKDEQTLEDKDIDLGSGGMRVEGDFKKAMTEIFNSLPKSAKIKAELWSENFPPTIYIYRKGSEE